MQAAISTIVTDVEVCMDEIAQNDSEFEGMQDDTERATIIKSKIEEALRFVNANADWSLLEPDYTETVTPTIETLKNGIKRGLYKLDTDTRKFLRLVYVRYSSWSRFLGQEDLTPWDSMEYSMLSDRYTTGTSDRPKAALVYRGGDKYLELYQPSSSASASILDFFMGKDSYVVEAGVFTEKYPEKEGEAPQYICVKQGDGWFCRKDVAGVYGDPDKMIVVVRSGETISSKKYNPSTFKQSDLNAITASDTLSIGIMKEPTVTSTTTTINVSDKCYRGLVYYIVGLTYLTYADQLRSQMMFSQARDIIGFSGRAAMTSNTEQEAV